METKEQEVNGSWMTEAKMKKDFNSTLICTKIWLNHRKVPSTRYICVSPNPINVNIDPLALLRDAVKSIIAYCERFPTALVRCSMLVKIWMLSWRNHKEHISVPFWHSLLIIPIGTGLGNTTRISESFLWRRKPSKRFAIPSCASGQKSLIWVILSSSTPTHPQILGIAG